MAKTVEEVYNVIESFGEQGCISDEIQEILSHRSYGTVTSKYSWLKSKGYIKVDMRVRKGKAGRPQHIMWTYDNYKESNNERI
jgi:response regulator of citrate/malate metabolism